MTFIGLSFRSLLYTSTNKLILKPKFFCKMVRIVECVPNFSEGRSKEVIDKIAQAISSTTGITLLNVDPGSSTNRTVYTFVGSPEDIIEGALNAAKAAYKLIDMTKHKGEHPRMGALDVCPFIPVRGVSMEDCVECSKIFGKKLAEELKVPVYLYGYAAKEDYRRTMPQIRAGEYENLHQKLENPEWIPDFGPAVFVPQWGATVTGARKFLIAYNINVLSTKEQCHRIALNIRQQGRGKDKPGRLKNVQAIGWYLEESNLSQISVNITDYEVTPIHEVFEEVCKDAKDLRLPVVGSQIVGIVPLKSILNAAEFYIKQENLFILEEEQKVRLAISRLGLGILRPFEPKEHIIEYMLPENTSGPLISLPLKDFILAVGARTSAPGGGSVAAVIASLGAALGTMVCLLTFGNRKYESLDSKMRCLIPKFHNLMKVILPMIDEDTNAFTDYMLACKMPKNTEEEKKLREAAQEFGLKKAIEVPLKLAQVTNTLWEPMKELAEVGNETAISDLEVAARSLETGVWGAYYNVKINIKNIKDTDYKTKIENDIDTEVRKAESCRSDVLSILSKRNV